MRLTDNTTTEHVSLLSRCLSLQLTDEYDIVAFKGLWESFKAIHLLESDCIVYNTGFIWVLRRGFIN